jgi:hypothetical protein
VSGEFTGLSIDDAVALAERKRDAFFEAHLVQQRALMADHGARPDDIEAAIDHWRQSYEVDREEASDQLRAWLLRCNKRLN